MNELTPEQKKKLIKLALVLRDGDAALVDHLFEIEETVEKSVQKLEAEVKDLRSLTEPVVKSLEEKLHLIKDGEVGEKGEPGKDGANGKDGINGRDGRDGKDGVDGKDGIGIAGPKGEDGKNGSPDTAMQVRDKLETLKEEERLDVSAIKGIDSLSKDIETRALLILDQRTKFLINKPVYSKTEVDAIFAAIPGSTPKPGVLSYTGDNLTTVAITGGKTLTFTYDGELLDTMYDGTTTYSFGYDGGDRLTSWTLS